MLTLLRKIKDDRQQRKRLEAALHAALGLGPYDVVRATEVNCGAEGCADLATTVLVMRAGCRTEMLRAEKPLAVADPGDFFEPALAHLPS